MADCPLQTRALTLFLLAIPAVVNSALAQQGPALVATAQAEMRVLPATTTLVGTVEPFRRSTLGAELAALVVEMPARQGDRVERGALLCRLKDDLLNRDLAQAEARLAALQAKLTELENGTRKEIIERLRADLDAASAMATRWDFELKRIQRLHGDAIANEREYQDTIAEKRAAVSRQAAAQAEYDEAVAGPRPEVIAQARYDLAEQQAEVDRIHTRLAKTRIRAPFTGFVTVRHAEVGNWLSVGDPVVEVIDLERVLVLVDVPEAAIPYATVGKTASVRIDALKRTLDGEIRHVIPQADEAARTFPVEIELANAEYHLKAGMFARATVPSGPETEMLAVPKDALIDHRGNMQVAIIISSEDGKMAMPTYVTLGADSGGWVAITSGNIPPGAEVATYGNEQLVYPQPVRVTQSRGEIEQQRDDSDSAPPAADSAEGQHSAAQG